MTKYPGKNLYRSRLLRSSVAMIIVSTSLHAFPGPGQPYTVKEDLGTLPGHTYSTAAAINSSRQITGQSGFAKAFLWSPPGTMVALAPTDKLESGNAINDNGQVAGKASFLNYAMDSFLWTPPGPGVYIVPPPGTLFDESAHGINNLGQVVGQWEYPPYRPYLWTAPGPATDLGTLGGNMGWASAINESTAVVGTSYLAGNNIKHGFFWKMPGGMQDLGALGASGDSAANAINESNQIAGSVTIGPFTHAALWDSPGTLVKDLGTLGGFQSRAFAINDSGVIAGYSELNVSSPDVHAFRLKPGGKMADLGTLKGKNSKAWGINNAGHIVGEAQLANGDTHAVAWWRYTVPYGNKCICAVVPMEKYLVLVVLGGKRGSEGSVAVKDLDVRLLTLGDSEGDDVSVARDQRTGAMLYEIYDVDHDGEDDLVASFDRADLIASGDISERTTQLWMQTALLDRAEGVCGIAALADHTATTLDLRVSR